MNHLLFLGPLFGTGVFMTIMMIVIFWLAPFIITIYICNSKGQPTCLGFLLAAFLSWIGVIIALCLTDEKKLERQHQETIAAITSPNRAASQTVIVKGNEIAETEPIGEVAPVLHHEPVNYRLMAIKNLKAIGAPFDEYDIEIEADKIKSEQDAVK
jgi:hypothetical protein